MPDIPMMCQFYRNGYCDCPNFTGICLYPYDQEVCPHYEAKEKEDD